MNLLIIFSRYPVPGKTKTRLIPGLGPTGAATFQKTMSETVLKTAIKAVNGKAGIEICFEGGSKKQIQKWLGKDISFSFQDSGDLGCRMRAAFEKAFQKGCQKVLLIGSDVPDITADYLLGAFDLLDSHDLVLGPVADGGYCLIGMSRFYDVFNQIAWGSEQVLDQTLSHAKALCLKTGLLEPLTDIDTHSDLMKWNADKARKKPYVSVIIPTLNEADYVEFAVKSAIDPDAEVIVIDGGSSDATLQTALNLGVRIETAPCGRWSQQNLGAALANGEVLLFLHADTRLPKGYVAKIFEALMASETIGGAFRFKTDWESPLMNMIAFFTNVRSRYFNLPYGDQGLFIRKSVFTEINGFPDTEIAEDLLLVKKLNRKGHIRIISASVEISARRWRKQGMVKTTLKNQYTLIKSLLGYGISHP